MYETERVDRVMTAAVVSIDVEEPASAVLRLFASYPIHHLPVLSGEKIVGMLSSADVMKLEAFLPKTGVASDEYLNQRITVASLMRKPVITIQPHQPLLDAASLMASHGIHTLPVVDDQDRLLGIITTTDIIHAVLQPPAQVAVASPSDGRPEPLDVRLTAAEFEQAIAAAKAAIYAGQDQHNIATALVGLQQRVAPLERVLLCADRYMNCGQDPPLYAALRKAIVEARRVVPSDGAEMPAPFGLPSD